MNKTSIQPVTSRMNVRALEAVIIRVLRHRGVDVHAIAAMSAIQVFDEYCAYYGLLKCGQDFAQILDGARAQQTASPSAPTAFSVFEKHCDKRNVKSMARHLMQILDNIRACELASAQTLLRAA